jgi:hypothetical protein
MSKSALASLILLLATAGSAACRGTPPSAQPSAATGGSIRVTDFRNFHYTFGETSWTLVNGREPGESDEEDWKFEFDDVSYGDVTGDGREEAIVAITAETGGTMVPHWIFVYGAGAGGPELLWAFESGDRAGGGLKRAYAEDGMLVVELLGKGMLAHDPATFGAEDETSIGACCPSMFTRSRYAWNGRAFVPHGDPEVLPYDPDVG